MIKKSKPRGDNELVLLPLGGTGEIGMNCYCYGVGPAEARQWLMVDLGVKFGGEKEPGIDVILPDVGFITSHKNDLVGLVVTHAHEDHIGAIAWLWPQLECDIHCTQFAAELIKLKLHEHGLSEEARLVVHAPGERFVLGAFTLELVSVTHSIPQANALYIKTDVGTVFHSGDWKIDRSPMLGEPFNDASFAKIGKEGVDVLVCDSTNCLREGFSPSEKDVAASLADILKHSQGRVAVTTFASHVERIYSVVKAARAADREVVLAGRAMRNTIEAARACGMLRDAGAFLDEEEFGYLPPDKVLLLCTGSQGEPRAALARIAEDIHPRTALEAGDLVIFSSRTIPGNEKDVGAVQNNLAKLGIEIMTSDDALVHSSGHPRQDELKVLYSLLKPKVLIPMHGEQRHMAFHAKFAKDFGIAQSLVIENGQIVRLRPGHVEVCDEAHSGVLHVDGKLIVDGVDGPARSRRKLSFAGIVIVHVHVSSNMQLVDDIEVILEGVPEGLYEDLVDAAESAFEAMPKARRKDNDTLEETLQTAVRRSAESMWGKKPVCKVIVVRE
jgi:ribonuclease J